MLSVLTLQSPSGRREVIHSQTNLSNISDGSYLFFGMNVPTTNDSTYDKVSSSFVCSELIKQLHNVHDASYMFAQTKGIISQQHYYLTLTLPNVRIAYNMFNNSMAESVDITLPNAKEGQDGIDAIFDNAPKLVNASLSAPNVKYFYYGNLSSSPLLQTLHLDIPKATVLDISHSTINKITGDFSSINSMSSAFNSCTNLTRFDIDLPSLEDGQYMFSNCSNLEAFVANTPKLTNGTYMFNNCPKLETIIIDLSNIVQTDQMFQFCNLNATSLIHILETLPQRTSSSTIKLPIKLMNGTTQITDNSNQSLTQAALTQLAKDMKFDSWSEVNPAFNRKGWSVQWCYGTTNTQIAGNYS